MSRSLRFSQVRRQDHKKFNKHHRRPEPSSLPSRAQARHNTHVFKTHTRVATLSVLGLAGSTPEAPKLERDATGAPDWRWKKGVPPLTQKVEMALVQQGVLKASERRTVVYADSGAELTLAGGAQQAPKAFHCIGVLLRYATGSFAKTGSGQKHTRKC
jgi:hypothetical protein